MNCFDCEMERGCKSFLDRISQEKQSTDINLLKGKPANEYYQMLHFMTSNMNLGKIILILNLLEKI